MVHFLPTVILQNTGWQESDTHSIPKNPLFPPIPLNSLKIDRVKPIVFKKGKNDAENSEISGPLNYLKMLKFRIWASFTLLRLKRCVEHLGIFSGAPKTKACPPPPPSVFLEFFKCPLPSRNKLKIWKFNEQKQEKCIFNKK